MIESIYYVISFIAFLLVTGSFTYLFYGIHDWIEQNWVNSFETALANGLVAVLTTLMLPIFLGVVTVQYLITLFI